MRFTGGSKRAIRTSGWRVGIGVVLVAVAATAAVFESTVPARGTHAEGRKTGERATAVALSALPPEARGTHALIRAGGPFPYSKDGSVFGNRERLLPGRKRGDYREYTVPTPKSHDRGARRIVCAGTVPSVPEACYYTDDHYASFRLIAQ
ncbi:MAG: ribonuclease N1 [Methylibium sp.]|uniref:ribonuclease domain-containing protein n=1 Tax=Methylibium sp. TaxID=2067992 RepID=UPI0017E8656C|nr:ribonuclease domain-containing protein [Methylibium sp.]MBA3596695.1 ribonuclease N1 [Methylibium sp.]